jgi:predicted MFS family arabinose efflux permease
MASASPAKTQKKRALMPFVIISITYLLFTVTDGAGRMIVLLHAYKYGFSAMQVAAMFSLYETAGVVTNLAAGLAGARWGIRCTLLTGLALQIVSYGLLFFWREDWSQAVAIAYVTVAQMFGGIAKDLTKLGGKTVTKLVTPAEKQQRLFKLVSALTGWKNSLKGVGYFLGAALIAISYELALAVMVGFLALALPIAACAPSPHSRRPRVPLPSCIFTAVILYTHTYSCMPSLHSLHAPTHVSFDGRVASP